MKILPEFRLGIGNGWIPLGLYFLALIPSILPYSQEARIWLFQNPVNRGQKIVLFIRRLGQFLMMAFILMMIFTPLNFHLFVFLLGALIFFSGLFLEISALRSFRMAPSANRLWRDHIASPGIPNGWDYSWSFWGRPSPRGYGFSL